MTGDAAAEWLLWQLVDSSFPSGGFAHSGGLEAACQHGEVREGSELAGFVEAALQQLGRCALPFVTAAHAEPHRLVEFDRLCNACTTNHVANRASRSLGRAFQAAIERVFGITLDKGVPPANGSGPDFPPSRMPCPAGRLASAGRPFCGHFPPVFGAASALLHIPGPTAQRLFYFMHLRGWLAAAVRLNIVGPIEAQKLQVRLSLRAEEMEKACAALTLDDVAQTSPLLDLWHGAHDRLHSRLFQS